MFALALCVFSLCFFSLAASEAEISDLILEASASMTDDSSGDLFLKESAKCSTILIISGLNFAEAGLLQSHS
jgi:hypothetical protein